MQRNPLGLFFSLVLILFITSCNDQIGSTTQNPVANIALSYVATIPTTEKQTSQSALLLINNTAEEIAPNFKIIAFESSQLVHIDASACKKVAAASSCQINLQLDSVLQSGSFILAAEAETNGGKLLSSRVIVYDHNLDTAGMNALQSNNHIQVPPGEKFSLAVPFLAHYSAKDKLNWQLDSGSGVQSIACVADRCTALITTTATNDLAVQLKINNALSAAWQVTVSNLANLVTSSSNLVLNPADGSHFVALTLLNSGSSTADNIVIGSQNIPGFLASSCNNGFLAANSSCTLNLKANSNLTGTGTLEISYKDAASEQTQPPINVYLSYLAADKTPGLTVSVGAGDFQDQLTIESRTILLTLQNNGTSDLNEITLSPLAAQNQYMSFISGTCNISNYSIASLAANSSCTINLNYNPQSAEAGNLVINFVAKYTDTHDQKISYASASQLNFNYNANPATVYLLRGTTASGITKCNLLNNGSFNSCIATATGLTNVQPLGLASFTPSDGVERAYVGNFAGTGTLSGCLVDESGGLSSCSSLAAYTGSIGQNVQNQIENINGIDYLYIASFANGQIRKCQLSSTSGAIASCVNVGFTGISFGSGARSIAFYNGYAYIMARNETKLAVCKVSAQDGSFSSCVLSGAVNHPNNAEFSTANGNAYIYISNDGDNDSYGYISRCLLSSLDGTLSACSNITGTLTNLRGIRKIAINGTNYLYFSNKSSGAIYRKVINSDASLGASAVVSSPSLSNVEYLAKNIKHRAARLGLIGNTNVYGTVTLNLFLIANNGINSSVVKLAPPTNSGISITPDTVSLDASAPSRPISIIIPESTPAGIYSLSATSNNGIPATTLNLNVLAPQTVTAVFPDTQSGISDGRTSVGLLPTIRITFSRAVDPVSLTNSSVQLKEASTGSQITLSAPAMSFSDRVAKFTLSANLSSGKTYQLSLVPSLIKDNYGNQMGAASPMLISTFRSGLKIFVTQSSHNGDFGGLAGADSFCQNDNNNPNSGNANYIYKAMLVAQAIFNGNQEARYPGTNWVLYSNQNYYKSDIAATFIAQTNSYGKLPNDFSNRIGDSRFVWSGSNPDWGTDEGAFGTNWACTNWSSASWVVAGYVGNSLKSDYNAWAYRDDGSEIDGKSHINKGDTLAAWCNSTLQVYCVQQD